MWLIFTLADGRKKRINMNKIEDYEDNREGGTVRYEDDGKDYKYNTLLSVNGEGHHVMETAETIDKALNNPAHSMRVVRPSGGWGT